MLVYSLRLRELRQKHGMTQQQVASCLQLTRDAYSLYELGKRQMNYETMCILADTYNVSIDYMLGRLDSNPVALNEDEYDMVSKYKLLDKRGQEAVKANIAFEGAYIERAKMKKAISFSMNHE